MVNALVQVAFGIQPWHAVPLGVPSRGQFLVRSHVRLTVTGNGRKLAVVLQFVLEACQLGDNLLAHFYGCLVGRRPYRLVHVVDTLRDDDRPAFARRSGCERGWVAGRVLRGGECVQLYLMGTSC